MNGREIGRKQIKEEIKNNISRCFRKITGKATTNTKYYSRSKRAGKKRD